MELLGCNRVRITFGFPLLSLTFAISIPNDSIDIPLFPLKSFTHFPYFNLRTAIFLYFEDDLLFVFLFLFSLGHEPRLFRLDHESERRVSPSTYFPSVRLSLSTRMFLGRYPNCVVISTLDFIPERRAACLPVYITKEIDGICFDFYFSKPPADKESGRSKRRRRTLILALVFIFFFSFFDC
jgi:hypothetical protein